MCFPDSENKTEKGRKKEVGREIHTQAKPTSTNQKWEKQNNKNNFYIVSRSKFILYVKHVKWTGCNRNLTQISETNSNILYNWKVNQISTSYIHTYNIKIHTSWTIIIVIVLNLNCILYLVNEAHISLDVLGPIIHNIYTHTHTYIYIYYEIDSIMPYYTYLNTYTY